MEGSVRVRIGDKVLSAEFNMPAGPCFPGVILPGLQRFANRLAGSRDE